MAAAGTGGARATTSSKEITGWRQAGGYPLGRWHSLATLIAAFKRSMTTRTRIVLDAFTCGRPRGLDRHRPPVGLET